MRPAVCGTRICRIGSCIACVLALIALVMLPAVASSAESVAPQEDGLSSLAGPLVIPSVESLTGAPLVGDQQAAAWSNPEAVSARGRSRTEFEQIGPAAAEKLAGEAFPGLVNTPGGGPPKLPAGISATGFPTDSAMAVDLPDGKHGVIESTVPIARETSPGHRVALDLTPRESGGGFAPETGLVSVHIPKHIAGGASLAESGVSLTPVDQHGTPLEGAEGVIDGAAVFYGDTEDPSGGVRDLDTLIKPETAGFSEETLLRSEESPSTLYYRVGLPEGASLVREAHGPNVVRVVNAGQTIAVISAPSAQDAEGVSVPLGMAVDGDTIVLSVLRGNGEYRYPIEVDPNEYDTAVPIHWEMNTNWHFHGESPGKFESYPSGEGVVMTQRGNYASGEHDELQYEAHGESSVMYIEEESSTGVSSVSGAITKLEFAHGSTIENWRTLGNAGESYPRKMERLCVPSGPGTCGVGSINLGNEVRLMQTATQSGTEGYGFWAELFTADVGTRQEKGPEAVFNTWSGAVEGWANVLYGSGGWLGGSGAFEAVSKDPGLGVSKLTIKDLTAGATLSLTKEFLKEGLCAGVWCFQERVWAVPYQSSMVEGSNTIETCAEDSANMSACSQTVVNVDDVKPYGVKLKGIAETGGEISPTRHQLTAEATDGTESAPGSGVQSIAVAIDGREIETPKGSCSPGKCTAAGTWTVDAETLGSGEHKLIVTAVDRAGNTERKEFTFAVRHASPASLGPGSVDTVTGQYRLTASDVDLAGVGSVTRAYSSRSWNAGLEGPLGPQWALSAGAGQTLGILPNGNAELRSSDGGRTTFGYKEGKFISPKGDENITLEPYEKEAGKGITEYLLKNPAAGTTTRFILPSGAGTWVPEATEGPAPEDTTTYSYRTAPQDNEYALPSGSAPWVIAQGPDGNLWFANVGTSKIGKITPAGGITEYALPNGSEPHAIAQGPDGNLWFTDWGTSKIGRITTAGGVTEYALPAGSRPHDITAGPNGRMWFTEYATNKIGEINPANPAETHEYSLPAYSEPHDIAPGPGDTLWFTDLGTAKVGLITTSGAAVEYSMPAGSIDPHAIAEGPNGELWYTVGAYTQSVQEMKATGEVEHTYPIPAGSEPYGITLGPDGNLWFADVGTSKIAKLSPTSGAITEYALPSGSAPVGIALGPDGNLWYTDESSNKVGVMTPAGVAVEPSEILGPVPANVSCGKNPQEVKLEELKAGCRALTFTYAEKTTATGEGASNWGEYLGRLSKVSFTAYSPATKVMQTTAVAQYSYDKQGRLRSEWDPRISPALKTSYGYDAEGHVTALTPSGQESWAFTYGMISGDPGAGRLLKATRAPASAALWQGESVEVLGSPKISGSPALGYRMTISDGTWSGKPGAYGYQWEDCNSVGVECTPIAGATNANYTPVSGDVGHTLVAQVTATNGDGSLVASSSASAIVTSTAAGGPPSYTQSVDSGNSLNAVACVPGTTDCVVSDSVGKAFYATNVSVSSAASWSSWSGPGASPSEALACPTTSLCLMAAGSQSGYGGSMYYATSLGGSWTLGYTPSYGVDAISCASSSFCIDGQDGGGYFRYATSPASTSWNLEKQGSATMKGVFCLSSSFCAIADGVGNVHVATSTTQIESSGWTETKVDGTTALNGIACTSTTSCVAVDGTGNVLNLTISGTGEATATKHNIDSTHSLSAVTCPTSSICVTVDDRGSVFTSTNAGETWTETLQLGETLTSVSCASATLCVTVDSTGHVTSFNPSLTQLVDSGNSINAVACVPSTTDCVITDSAGKAFYSTNVSTVGASWSSWTGPGTSPSEAVACPSTSVCLMAAGTVNGYGGNLYYATSLGGAWSTAYSPGNGVDAIACASATFCVDGQDAFGYFRYSTSPASTSWTLEEQGSAAMKAATCLSSSFCAIADGAGNVYVATTKAQVESSGWTSTKVDGTTALNGVACTSTTSCVAVDGAGNVISLAIAGGGAATATKHNIDSTNSLAAVTCPTSSTCVAVDDHGNVFVSTNAGEVWTNQYHPGGKLTSVACVSASLCVTADATGNVTTFNPAGGAVHEGEVRTPQPGSTVEYNVPVSGVGAPYAMGNTELAAWGQTKDLPKEATAIFPPDEPMGWPASNYKRATIDYLDEHSRTVDAASPAGGISTVEYNAFNEVTRSLSAADRAIAMKETCESETKCKSAEVAKVLSSEKVYNGEGTQLLETVGPEHKIKLANGTEEETRDRQTFSYNEGQPSGGVHNLVTLEKRWSETVSKKEVNVRIAHNYYNGQSNLGWQLRKPTMAVSEAGGHTTTTTTQYQPATGAPMEAHSGQGANGAGPIFGNSFGADRGGHGKFNWPKGMAIDGKGNIWVADTYNQRVQEFSASGAYIRQFGSWGTGNGQMEYPTGIAVDGAGHVWITDIGAQRVEEFSETGAYLAQFGSEGTANGQLKKPEGIAVDSKGNIWVVDTGNNRVQEFNSKLEYVAQFGGEGSGNGQFKAPRRVVVDAKGNIWISDGTNCRIQEFNEKREFVRTFGSCGSGNGQLNDPQGMTLDGAGHLWVADENNDRIEEFTEEGVYVSQFSKYGTGNGFLSEEEGVALDSEGDLWVLDTGNARLQRFTVAGSYLTQVGTKGSPEEPMDAPKGVAVDPSGNVWVADTYNDRIDEYSSTGEFIAKYGSEGTGNGQFKLPRAIAVDAKSNLWVADQNNNRVEELNSKGEYLRQFGSWGTEPGQFKEPQGVTIDTKGNVWVADTVNNRIQEFSETGTFMMKFGSAGAGNGQLSEPRSMAVDPSGNVWVSDSDNNRLEEFNSKGEYVMKVGEWGNKEGQFEWPLGVALDQHGRIWVADANNDRIQELTTTGAVIGTFGTAGSGNGQMSEPRAIAIDPYGNAWVADTNNNRVERWTVAMPTDSQIIYYTATANPVVPACGEHPEWANLICQTEPLAQAANSVAPQLPIVTTTYNMWGEPETIVEKLGSVTKTIARTYDGAGRQVANEETSTSSEDAALPAVTDEYNAETGALVKRNETLAGKVKTITSVYNTLGQLISYTDAAASTTKYTYDVDGRIEEMSEPKGKQTYSYDTTSGFLTKLWDSAAGTFTATYSVSGQLLTDSYPNGMVAKYTYNPIGQAINLEYEKTTHCSEKCVLFSDADTYGPGGEHMTQTSSLAEEKYTYNEARQLVQTQETPVGGKGCVTRAYTYDEQGHRTGLTTREPNAKGECTSEGGLVETHAYDSASRLIDPGVTYDALGNMTKVPAADAGGMAITSSFYVDNQVVAQEQNKKTLAYTYDPTGRTLTAKATQESGTTEAILHYAGPEEAITWTCEEVGECIAEAETKWTRNIPGIGGVLDAIQTNGGTPVLQLHDLQGDIVATAADNEAEAKLLSSYNSTEFGVPNEGKAPPKYAWLGAVGAASELGTGVITEEGSTYVPQLGQTLQTEALVPPGTESECIGCGQIYITQESAMAIQSGNEAAANTLAEQRTLEAESEVSTTGELGDPIKCVLSISGRPHFEEEGANVMYAEATAYCGMIFPRGSKLEVCMIPVGLSPGISPTKNQFCNTYYNVVMIKKVKVWVELSRLNVRVETKSCIENIAYKAWGWLWVPGFGTLSVQSINKKFGTGTFTCPQSIATFVPEEPDFPGPK